MFTRDTSLRAPATDAATAERLQSISELVEDASARLAQLLILTDARLGSAERREIEEAAHDLRAAMHYLELHVQARRDAGRKWP